MVISHEHKYICYMPHKTGSVTLNFVLQNTFKGEVLSSPYGDQWGRHHFFLPAKYESYFTFITVRNPYERFLSAYNYFDSLNKYEFNESIDKWLKPISYSIDNPIKYNEECIPIRIDKVLKIESFNQDFNSLPFVKSSVNLPNYNIIEKKFFKIPECSFKLIRDKFHEDFVRFDYPLSPPKHLIPIKLI